MLREAPERDRIRNRHTAHAGASARANPGTPPGGGRMVGRRDVSLAPSARSSGLDGVIGTLLAGVGRGGRYRRCLGIRLRGPGVGTAPRGVPRPAACPRREITQHVAERVGLAAAVRWRLGHANSRWWRFVCHESPWWLARPKHYGDGGKPGGDRRGDQDKPARGGRLTTTGTCCWLVLAAAVRTAAGTCCWLVFAAAVRTAAFMTDGSGRRRSRCRAWLLALVGADARHGGGGRMVG